MDEAAVDAGSWWHCEDVKWIKLAQDDEWWRDLVVIEMNLWVLQKDGKFWSVEQRLDSYQWRIVICGIRIRHCFKQNSGSAYQSLLRTNWQTKCTMCLRVTLYWGYLIVLWLFHLVCILYCGCFNWFCNVWLCVYVVVLRCVSVLVICVLVFTVFLYCLYCVFVLFRLCIFILICFVCTSVRTNATDWQLNCNNNNNNNNIYYLFCLYWCKD